MSVLASQDLVLDALLLHSPPGIVTKLIRLFAVPSWTHGASVLGWVFFILNLDVGMIKGHDNGATGFSAAEFRTCC